MAKKNKGLKDNSSNNTAAATNTTPTIDGGVYFSSADTTLTQAQSTTGLEHITKPWTRDAWEKARPWILEQRQKLEAEHGWTPAPAARTELFVLKRNAPQGAMTDDGLLYLRIPKKFVDFMRSGRDQSEVKRRVSAKKKDLSYKLDCPATWKLKICNEVSKGDHHDAVSNVLLGLDSTIEEEDQQQPNVQLDVAEPLENIMYLTMTLQPGLARLHAQKMDAIQRGTLIKEIKFPDDITAEVPTMRYRALVAEFESYTRTLPPSWWLIRNAIMLRTILGEGYEPTLAAAEEQERSVTRFVKNIAERVWEEALPQNVVNQILAEREWGDADTAVDGGSTYGGSSTGHNGKRRGSTTKKRRRHGSFASISTAVSVPAVGA
ncbi:hypothetical protein V8E36_000970 [Tilletia maclaganii]